MTSLRTRALLLAPVATVALVLTPAVAASAHEGGGANLIKADFTPSLPTDAPIFGVKAGGAPWVLREGEVRVRADGRIRVELEGLQIPRPDGTRSNPITKIVASLFCGGTFAVRTEPQDLSVPGGDAKFRATIAVPATCDMATVLISPAVNTNVYIASAMAEPDED